MIKPSYYNSFKCIASKCKHNCCIGWEIDIDTKTLSKYLKAKGKMGEKLKKGISGESFKLTREKRCPFLTENNLCEIILNMGERSLCDICRLHPRFFNYVAGRYEVGIGLCCEAAAKIILEYDKKVKVSGIHFVLNKEESDFLKLRKKIFKIIQSRDLSLTQRIELISKIAYDFDSAKDMLLNLEKLDSKSNEYFVRVGKGSRRDLCIINHEKWQKAFENLLVYFVYRHFTCLDASKLEFAVFSMQTIAVIFSQGEQNICSLEDIARVYSAEIEYCEENTERVIKYLCERELL